MQREKTEKRPGRRWLFAYAAALLLFTLYASLDAFVIPRVYTLTETAEATQAPGATEAPETAEADTDTETETQTETVETETVVTDASYVSGGCAVTLTQYREYDTDIYVAEVVLSSPSLLKTALAQSAYGRNVTEKTSAIAAANNAVLAINGDYYGSQEKGYVLRNGVIYRDTAVKGQEDLVIYGDGSFKIVTENQISLQTLLSEGAEQVLSFGPALVIDGEIAITEDEEVGKAKSSNPRTAIACIAPLHYLFIVSDGRTAESEGLSLYELAVFSKSLGADVVYNLDGGGSSTLYFNGQVINNPTTNGSTIQERSVSDIVYIGC